MKVCLDECLSADVCLSEFISSQMSVSATKIHYLSDSNVLIQSEDFNQETLNWKLM